jgi:hypothetical protein
MIKKKAKRVTTELTQRLRMQAIEVAARLPEPEGNPYQGLQGGGFMRPGKSAEKVVQDAKKIMEFVFG